MRGARVYPALLLSVALAGCSGAERPELAAPARPRTIELHWVERSGRPGFVFRVERLVITDGGWSAEVAVENRTAFDYSLQRPHRPRGQNMLGLVLLETAGKAELRKLTAGLRKAPPFLEPDRITPRPPPIFRAGQRWSGRLTGSAMLRRGSVVRILFGRFSTIGRVKGPRALIWVTDHAVRL